MAGRAFVTPVLDGPRFREHTIPVEVLPELAIYRAMLVDVARVLFLAKHPRRKKVPKGFVESFQLRLTKVDEGSAIPVLERELVGLTPPLFADVFDDARDLVGECIACASEGKDLPAEFPRDLIGLFNGFGQRLRPDESLELRRPGAPRGPVYTQEVRKRIVLQASSTYAAETEVTGAIVEADRLKNSFQLRLDNSDRVIGAPFQVSMKSAIIGALDEFEIERVRVVGVGSFDRDDQLERFTEVHHITSVEEGKGQFIVDERIDELAALKSGWFNDAGEAFDADGVRWVQRFLHVLIEKFKVPAPFLYPSPEGDIDAEWSLGKWEVSATFHLADRSVALMAVDTASDDAKEKQSDQSVAAREGEVAEFLAQFLATTSH